MCEVDFGVTRIVPEIEGMEMAWSSIVRIYKIVRACVMYTLKPIKAEWETTN